MNQDELRDLLNSYASKRQAPQRVYEWVFYEGPEGSGVKLAPGQDLEILDPRTDEQKDMDYACEEVNRIAPGTPEFDASIQRSK